MGKIFISYSRRDLAMVDRIVGKMEDTGMSIWIDRDAIKAGNLWRTQIVEAIDTCDAVVFILSSNSAASDNVRKEIDLAQDSGRKIFIMRLNEVTLPANIRYQLAGLQYIDLHILGFDEAVKQLIETLKEQSKPIHEPLIRQAELVFPEVDLAEFGVKQQEQTLDLISALTGTPQSQLNIAKVTAGMHVFVDMPAPAAFKLKTRALNRDDRLKQFGIKSLRLVGDKKFVNVSLGVLSATATIGILQLFWMNIPPLLPSLLGITGGKLVLFTTAFAVTTAAGLAISGVPKSLQTPVPTPEYSIAEAPPGMPFLTPTQAEIATPGPDQAIAITPFDTPMSNSTIAPALTRTPIPLPSRTPALVLTTASTAPSSVLLQMAQIVSVECGSGLSLNVHIRITNEAGINSYSVWSTWGGGGQIDQTFSSPLPTVIDQVIVHTHDVLDPVDRQHQVGLMVTTPDNAQPIYTYAMEPGGRCPDHYQSPQPTPTDTPLPPSPILQVTDVFLQADPIDYVGSCPVRITFSGIVSVYGSGTVSYQFLRIDGASAPIQTLTFDGPGSQNVSDTWDLGEAGFTYSGWDSIQIIDPQALTSNQAAFSIQCQ